jgi:hypothetical protein
MVAFLGLRFAGVAGARKGANTYRWSSYLGPRASLSAACRRCSRCSASTHASDKGSRGRLLGRLYALERGGGGDLL